MGAGREGNQIVQPILDVIQRRRSAFEQHPFIRFLRDEGLPAQQRLAYAPYASHFVLTFADFNREFLREDEPDTSRQEMVNRHADEDATHYAWFLHDLDVLGFNPECRFTDALSFLWNDLGKHARAMGHFVIAATRDTSAPMRLVIIEALEAQGNVWLTATVQAASSHPDRDKLRYFSQSHLDRETGHAIGSDVDEIHSTVLPTELRARAETLVHGIFDHTEAFCDEILRRTQDASKSTMFGLVGEATGTAL